MYPIGEIVYEADDPNLWDTLPSATEIESLRSLRLRTRWKRALRREYTQAYHACITFLDAIEARFGCLEGQWPLGGYDYRFTSDHSFISETTFYGRKSPYSTSGLRFLS